MRDLLDALMRTRREIALINRHADSLNAEMKDALVFQAGEDEER